MKAVSDEEKKALKSKNRKKRINAGKSIVLKLRTLSETGHL